MSTLIETPNVFPPTLLLESEIVAPRRRWSVVYTKSRQEKALARDLFAHEIPFYLPMARKTSSYGNRKISSQLPLFPGYLFFQGTEDERVQVLQTNRISRILAVDDSVELHCDLLWLDQMIASGFPLTVESQLTAGHRVRIRRGPLAGLEGTVLIRRGINRLLVSVDFLQQGASVAIDDHLLERID
jgi:transcription antitermination factor NusG